MPDTNTLAYLASSSTTKETSSITLTPGGLPAVAGEPLRVNGEVDVVAVVAGLAVDVAEVVPGIVVVKPRLEVSLHGLTQRRVDLGAML